MLEVEPEIIPQKVVSSNAMTTASGSDTNASKESSSKKEEVIDLTMSDSDDEPLMPRKKQAADSPNQNVNCSGK